MKRALVLVFAGLAFGGTAHAEAQADPEAVAQEIGEEIAGETTEEVSRALLPEGEPADAPLAESAGALSAPTPDRVQLIALESIGHGVDAVVPRFVTDRLRGRLALVGHGVWDGPSSHLAAQRAGLPPAPSLAALERVAQLAGVGRVVSSEVWAERGRYVVQILVVSLDGSPPVSARVAADAQNLGPAVDALVDERVPPVESFDRDAAARAIRDQAAAYAPPAAARPLAPVDRRPSHRGAIALAAGPGLGMGESKFYVFNLRARFELRFTETFAASVVTGYVNLPGGGQRVHNVPVLGQVEYKVAIADLTRLRIPVRFALGYLPYNGPIARASVGLNYAIGEAWEVGADLLAPTFLNTPSDHHIAFELSLELVRRFGALARRAKP